MRQHIGVIFHEKLSITLPILLICKLNLCQDLPYIPLMCDKFESNLIMHLHFTVVFSKCVKRRKKMSDFLKADKSGKVGMIYFRSDMCSPLICWHLHSQFGFVRTGDHGGIKLYFVLRVIILTLCMRAPFSWAAQHYTTVCLNDLYWLKNYQFFLYLFVCFLKVEHDYFLACALLLISGKPVSQYTSHLLTFSPLRSIINGEQHGKYFYNQSIQPLWKIRNVRSLKWGPHLLI